MARQRTYKEIRTDVMHLHSSIRTAEHTQGYWGNDDIVVQLKREAAPLYDEIVTALDTPERTYVHGSADKREIIARAEIKLKSIETRIKSRVSYLIEKSKSEQKSDQAVSPEPEKRTIDKPEAKKRTGKRKNKPGAGRPAIGSRRVITLVLPDEEWARVDQAIQSGSATSLSDYFRQLHVGG